MIALRLGKLFAILKGKIMIENTTSQTIAEIGKALAAAQGEMSGAKKDSANPFFKSRYSDLASVIGALRGPFSKHGIAHVQIPGSDTDGYFVDTLLIHSSGEWIKGRIRMNPVREDPQGIGSVITYQRRYALQAMAGLESEDDDGNKASHSDSGPAKPALKPLAPGSFQQAQTVSRPVSKPVESKGVMPNESSPKSDPGLHDCPQSKPMGWREVLCHLGTQGGPVRGKKLLNLTETSIDWLKKKLGDINEPTQQDNLLKAALALRDVELKPTPAQTELGSSRVNLEALQAKCEEAKIPLPTMAKVSRTLGGSAEYFADIPEDEAGHILRSWDDTLEAVKFEMDNIPL